MLIAWKYISRRLHDDKILLARIDNPPEEHADIVVRLDQLRAPVGEERRQAFRRASYKRKEIELRIPLYSSLSTMLGCWLVQKDEISLESTTNPSQPRTVFDYYEMSTRDLTV